ncbi:hypothetical protein QEG98_29370 [Myxococcus sp. MxC21-1]|nr:hypothetical protein [Myxococcus sp. MxC21-1]WNZ60099.1 hypothetical protein QEG98_29370 [Myxococcus sp. MxC21-1]
MGRFSGPTRHPSAPAWAARVSACSSSGEYNSNTGAARPSARMLRHSASPSRAPVPDASRTVGIRSLTVRSASSALLTQDTS